MARAQALDGAGNSAPSRQELRFYVAQRISAAVLAPLVLIHLLTIVYAVRGGLGADEILARTRGSAFWAGFYGLFVIAVAVHAPIGLRTILREMTAWRGRSLDVATALFALFILWLGLRAIAGVI